MSALVSLFIIPVSDISDDETKIISLFIYITMVARPYAIAQYGSVRNNSRLGFAIALPNQAWQMLGFVPQPNLRRIRFLILSERYCAIALPTNLLIFLQELDHLLDQVDQQY